MLTSIRGLSAATLTAGLFLSATPAFASEPDSQSSVSHVISATEVISTTDLAADSTADDVSAVEISDEMLAAAAIIHGTSEERSALILPPALARASAPIEDASISSLQSDEDEAASSLTFSANVALTTEYRFRGVALTDGEFAIQGGFDLSHDSGLYIGTWASNLDEQTVGYGSTELDLYGGWSGNLTDALSADVGVIAYLYPDAGPGEFDYLEFYGSLAVGIGPASLTGGFAYAPEQDSLGGTDNLYFYTDASVGVPDTPITLNAHIGYTEGFLTFTADSAAIDWSISADLAVGPVTFSAAYVGVEGDVLLDPNGTFTDDAFVATVSASF